MKSYIYRQFAKFCKVMDSRTGDHLLSIGWSVTGVVFSLTNKQATNNTIVMIICFVMAQLIAGNRRRG